MFVTLPTGSGEFLCYAIFAFDDMYSHVGSIALIVSPLKALMKDQVSPLVATLMVIWVLLLPHKVIQQLFYSAQLLAHTRTQPYLSHSSIS